MIILIYHSLTHFVVVDSRYYYSSTHSVLFDSHYVLLINSFCIIWSSLLFTTLHLSLFLFICPYILSHISFWMADPNAIYNSSLIIYYSSTLFLFYFFAWKMLISHIIQVLLFITHQLIFLFYFFSSTNFPPLGWLMLYSFSS